MKRLCQWLGSGVVALAIAVLVASVIYPSTLGGDVVGGKVEDGRYFVVGKGHRFTEVSETQWRIEQYLECSFPWFPVMLIWIGVGLRCAPDVEKPPVAPPSTDKAMMGLLIAAGVVAGTGALALLRCFNTGVPWTIGLGVWLALLGLFFFLVWLEPRSSRPHSDAESVCGPSGLSDGTSTASP